MAASVESLVEPRHLPIKKRRQIIFKTTKVTQAHPPSLFLITDFLLTIDTQLDIEILSS
jgi:hypothetical protein